MEWIESISHANAYPVCMYAGVNDAHQLTSWLDYPTHREAAADGALDLRQNIRLLDTVVRLGVEGWLRLIEAGRVNPHKIDWLLCHYSSHFFRSQIIELLTKADCMVPEERCFTNLYSRGNTGCASIYLMIEELFHSGKLQDGQQIFCFVPESGRFTTAYMLLTVVTPQTQIATASAPALSADVPNTAAEATSDESAELLRQLMLVWLEFERELRHVPIVQRLHQGNFTIEDYKALLMNLRPQVVEGARWIARAASNAVDFQLRALIIGHAKDEHRDFQMLERDYVSVGGKLNDITHASQNIGSEALSAYIFHHASQENPFDLLGSMFIIEGLGNRLAGQSASMIRQTLGLSKQQISFLGYHADNDEAHIEKLNSFLEADWMTPKYRRSHC